jgi:hypothetical protein
MEALEKGEEYPRRGSYYWSLPEAEAEERLERALEAKEKEDKKRGAEKAKKERADGARELIKAMQRADFEPFQIDVLISPNEYLDLKDVNIPIYKKCNKDEFYKLFAAFNRAFGDYISREMTDEFLKEIKGEEEEEEGEEGEEGVMPLRKLFREQERERMEYEEKEKERMRPEIMETIRKGMRRGRKGLNTVPFWDKHLYSVDELIELIEMVEKEEEFNVKKEGVVVSEPQQEPEGGGEGKSPNKGGGKKRKSKKSKSRKRSKTRRRR